MVIFTYIYHNRGWNGEPRVLHVFVSSLMDTMAHFLVETMALVLPFVRIRGVERVGFGPGLKRDGRWSKVILSAHIEAVSEITGIDIHPSYVLPRCSIRKSTSSSFQELCLLSYHFVLNIRLCV